MELRARKPSGAIQSSSDAISSHRPRQQSDSSRDILLASTALPPSSPQTNGNFASSSSALPYPDDQFHENGNHSSATDATRSPNRRSGRGGDGSSLGGRSDRSDRAERSSQHGLSDRSSSSGDSGKALVLMALLSLQYGLQPILARKLLSREVLISSQVIACEVFKVTIAISALLLEGSLPSLLPSLSPLSSLRAALPPGLLYAAQNTLVQLAYRHLDYLTFNLLNQTKLLFTALSNFLFLSIRQTRLQLIALLLLIAAATMLTVGPNAASTAAAAAAATQQGATSAAAVAAASAAAWDHLLLGVLPVLIASLTSGLGSTYNQWQVQSQRRNPHLFTVEMCSLTSLVLLLSLSRSDDGEKMRRLGFFHGWTTLTVLPALSNAFGGILVGLVTKYAGGVKKGFTVISGLLVTAIAQYLIDGTPPSMLVWLALPLVVTSTYLYSKGGVMAMDAKKRE